MQKLALIREGLELDADKNRRQTAASHPLGQDRLRIPLADAATACPRGHVRPSMGGGCACLAAAFRVLPGYGRRPEMQIKMPGRC